MGCAPSALWVTRTTWCNSHFNCLLLFIYRMCFIGIITGSRGARSQRLYSLFAGLFQQFDRAAWIHISFSFGYKSKFVQLSSVVVGPDPLENMWCSFLMSGLCFSINTNITKMPPNTKMFVFVARDVHNRELKLKENKKKFFLNRNKSTKSGIQQSCFY